MAEQTQQFQGVYAHGKLEGVDFTVAGSMIQDGVKTSYGSSVKLNMSTLEKITKDVEGVSVPTLAKRPFTISISCETDRLASEVEKWNKLVQKELNLRLQPSKNATFKISEESK